MILKKAIFMYWKFLNLNKNPKLCAINYDITDYWTEHFTLSPAQMDIQKKQYQRNIIMLISKYKIQYMIVIKIFKIFSRFVYQN